MAAIYIDAGLGAAYDFIEGMVADLIEEAASRGPDAKTTLQEWAQSRGLEPPEYLLVDQAGLQHAPVFTIAVRVNGFEPTAASGTSKKVTEQKAAEAFLLREKVWKASP